nr:ABC transporter ATP-binding protein [Enterococcus gilvus]
MMFELEDVCFSYPETQREVFAPYSTTIPQGAYLLLMGDNGSGKSTLLNLLAGFQQPSAGKILFKGEDMRQWQKKKKAFYRHFGILFQEVDHQLFNNSVYDEIAFGPRQLGLSEEEVRQRVEDCLDLLSIAPLRQRVPYQLSGGEKKKVAFASILAMNPETFLLDEPFNGLTKDSEKLFKEILRKLHDLGKTILIASHDYRSFQDEPVDVLLFTEKITPYKKEDIQKDQKLIARLASY